MVTPVGPVEGRRRSMRMEGKPPGGATSWRMGRSLTDCGCGFLGGVGGGEKRGWRAWAMAALGRRASERERAATGTKDQEALGRGLDAGSGRLRATGAGAATRITRWQGQAVPPRGGGVLGDQERRGEQTLSPPPRPKRRTVKPFQPRLSVSVMVVVARWGVSRCWWCAPRGGWCALARAERRRRERGSRGSLCVCLSARARVEEEGRRLLCELRGVRRDTERERDKGL